jgi:hypothetical protein
MNVITVIRGLTVKRSFHPHRWPNLVKFFGVSLSNMYTKPELNTESEKSAWRGMIPILIEVYRTGLLK